MNFIEIKNYQFDYTYSGHLTPVAHRKSIRPARLANCEFAGRR